MNPAAYLESIRERLLTDACIQSFEILRERVTPTDAHIRTRLTLIDDTLLEFSEYAQRRAGGGIEVVTYSYQWQDEHDRLIRRWDNAPHCPDLPGFPHHVHDGRTGATTSGEPTNIFVILDHLAALV